MSSSNYWRSLAKEIGITDAELWGARLVARFAQDRPDEYGRAVERICRQDGDPVEKMCAYVQLRLKQVRNAE